jgi:hypothetical protein
MDYFDISETIPLQSNGLTFFFQLRAVWQRSGRRQRGERQVGTGDSGLHNITDVIRGICYPVSATDTTEEPDLAR